MHLLGEFHNKKKEKEKTTTNNNNHIYNVTPVGKREVVAGQGKEKDIERTH